MRVLWFSNTPAAGDEYISSNRTGGWLKSLDKAIQDKVDLHVAFYDRHYPSNFTVGKTKYHQLSPKGFAALVIRRLKLKLGINPDVSRWLEVIAEVKPDIIHIHGTENPWILLARHTDIPVILSIQGIHTVINYKYYSGIAKCDLPVVSSYKRRYRSFLKEGKIERDYLKYIHHVMGRTGWDRRVYSVLAPHAAYHEGGEVLRDGFYNTEWKQSDRDTGKIIVHTTTSGLLFKGLETICLALSVINRSGVEAEWRVAGVEENSAYIKIIKHKLGRDYPEKGLSLLGQLPESDLISKMLEADIYVSPSHQENSSNSLCEAAIMGMPCISTFVGGCGSIIVDRETGIMVQDGDPWAMAGAVLEMAADKTVAVEYGRKARAVALCRHNKEKVVSQVVEAYRSIVAEKTKKV